ncbi:MAG: hypothetical protein O3A14_19015 [Cyanobacteria bacterium]|nr:hypothetical protein [Cyanobacteriota bacterium]
MDHVINVTLCVDNAAFGDSYPDQAAEIARIFRDAADRIEAKPSYIHPFSGIDLCLNDINGNRVGIVTANVLPLS